MKSSFDPLRIAALSVASLALLGGCGQRGPLYLPGTQPPAKVQANPNPKPSSVPTADTPVPSK